MNKDGVLVVGSANMDLVVTTERFPKPGETLFGKNFKMFPGGKGANQAVACAKLCCKTYFIGKFGDDDFCGKITESMKNDGVDLLHVFIDKDESTGTGFIVVDDNGQNQIIVISGSNMKLSPGDVESKRKVFGEVKVVLSQLEVPLQSVIKIADLAKENDALFILNPAPAKVLPAKLFLLSDYMTPNETELELLSGIEVYDEKSAEAAAKILLTKGVKNVIVTMGARGALLVNNNVVKMYPAYTVKPVDTTAAGDAFNGALACSLSEGKNIDEAIMTANKAASLSVTKMGAMSSMPRLEDIKDLIHIQ